MKRISFGVALSVVAILICPFDAHATEPDREAVQCLTDILLTAPNAVSIKPADDWVYPLLVFRQIGKGGEIQDFKSYNYFSQRKGVEYTFRKSDNSEQTVGIYLGTEFEDRIPVSRDPNMVFTAFSALTVVSDNGRFAIIFRPPYPRTWFPSAKAVFIPPNTTKYVRQDSKENPLYGLWDDLATRCKIDNLELNGPVP